MTGQEEAATDGEIRLAANDTGNRNGYVECGSQNGCQLVSHGRVNIPGCTDA